MKKVCIVGLGYIGLPTALVAAKSGYEVVGFDIDERRVARINNYDPVIEEPEIEQQLFDVLRNFSFRASTIIEHADYYLIAVPTPFKEQKKADLSFVWQAGKSIATVVQKGDVIILESTVSVGATDQLAKNIEQDTNLKNGVDFFVAHCPERVLPGNIFHELTHNARIIGGADEKSAQLAAEFYKPFVKGSLYLTNAVTAEMVKLIENSSRDVAIAFANQVAAMATAMHLNPFEVIELANQHPRVNILKPSCGVGGHCIAIDPWFLIETFPEHTQLLQAARAVNDAKPYQVVEKVVQAISTWRNEHKQEPTVLLLGLTYKPDIDDLRESPALHIAQILYEQYGKFILVCEPYLSTVQVESVVKAPHVTFENGVSQADIVVSLVAHKQFKNLAINTYQHKKLIDFCGILFQSPFQKLQLELAETAQNATQIFFERIKEGMT